MEFTLVRHGRTESNKLRRYCGSSDEPLCAEGIEDARLSGSDDTVQSVYVSPMKRALETARIKFPNAALTICADLREMDFGDFEGRSADEMAQDPAYAAWLESNCTSRCPNGEKMDEFIGRVCRAFDTIVRECIANGDTKLVLVAHGGSLMSILSRYAEPKRQYYEWYADNCCGYRGRLDETSWENKPALYDCVMFKKLQ